MKAVYKFKKATNAIRNKPGAGNSFLICAYPEEWLSKHYPHGKPEVFRISTVVDQIKKWDFLEAEYQFVYCGQSLT